LTNASLTTMAGAAVLLSAAVKTRPRSSGMRSTRKILGRDIEQLAI
jgi:hypothetical protein